MNEELENKIQNEIKSLKNDLKDIKPSNERLKNRINMTIKLKQELDESRSKSNNENIVFMNSETTEKNKISWQYWAAASVVILGSIISYSIFNNEKQQIETIDNQIAAKKKNFDTVSSSNSDLIVLDSSSKIDNDTIFVQKSELELVKSFPSSGFGFASINTEDDIINELNSVIGINIKFIKDKQNNMVSNWMFLTIDKNNKNKVRFVIKKENDINNLYLEKTNIFKNKANDIVITDSIIKLLK